MYWDKIVFKKPVLPKRFAHAMPVIYEGIISGIKKHILKTFLKGRFTLARKNPAGMPNREDKTVVTDASIRLWEITFTYSRVKKIFR